MAKFVINNPYLAGVTYDICYNLPTDKIRTLSFKYRRMFASSVKTKNFCERASMDERIHFFNEIGLSCGFTVFPDKIKSGVALKEIFKKYEDERLLAAQKDHAQFGIYVTTDKTTAFLMGLMSQTINNEIYLRTLDFNKVGHNIKGWSKRLDTLGQKEVLEVADNADLVAKTMLNTMVTLDVSSILFEANPISIKTLLLFYLKRQSYVSRESVYDFFGGYQAKQKTTSGIKKLILNEYIKSHLDWKLCQYTITSKGINLVNDFINRIIKQNNF